VGARILARLGYGVDVAVDGREAVAAVARREYGAVLMDCRMPEMDGYLATAEIRRREPASRRLPVIAMTASACEEVRERCLAAGMDDCVAKPIMVADLEAVLARWVPDRATAPPAAGPAEAPEPAPAPGPAEASESALRTSLAGALLAGAPADLADLRAAVGRGDARAVRFGAHRLKGATATLGVDGMAALCDELETLARAGELTAAGDLLGRLEQELDHARTALDANAPKTPR
ncbi:MAG TPA: response regulator, partial [Actinomycetota bacterium]|nr:response regulator [Actinomycetota bacterium]